MPSYYEGLPMSILEAMAASTPVISTSVGGIPEAVENGTEGLLVKPGDISALANSINILLSDAETWEKMSRAGRKKIEAMFSLKHNLSQLEKLYAEMGSLE
jgi:glycosyltransferase involved in cell wall biosynthesis